MFSNKHTYQVFSVVLATFAVAAPQWAIGATTCASGQICINEAAVDGAPIDEQQSFYQIINNSGSQIFGFAIYNKDASNVTTTTDESGWSGVTISSNQWKSRGHVITFDNQSKWYTGVFDDNSPSLLEEDHLGSFETTFSETFDENFPDATVGANFYWNNAAKPSSSSGASTPLTNGTSLSQFYYRGGYDGGSRFVAYDLNGAQIEVSSNLTLSSLTTATPDVSVSSVPEPNTYIMFLAGLGLLGFMSRQKQ
jgi:hypothetical protein